jgi:hypothetical protein
VLPVAATQGTSARVMFQIACWMVLGMTYGVTAGGPELLLTPNLVETICDGWMQNSC